MCTCALPQSHTHLHGTHRALHYKARPLLLNSCHIILPAIQHTHLVPFYKITTCGMNRVSVFLRHPKTFGHGWSQQCRSPAIPETTQVPSGTCFVQTRNPPASCSIALNTLMFRISTPVPEAIQQGLQRKTEGLLHSGLLHAMHKHWQLLKTNM